MCASRALLRARATGGTRLERVTHGVPLRRCEAGDDGRPVRVRRVSVLCAHIMSCRCAAAGKIITMHTRIRLTLKGRRIWGVVLRCTWPARLPRAYAATGRS